MAPAVPRIGAGRSGDPTETAAVHVTVRDALMNYSSNIMITHNTVRHGMLYTCAELKLKNKLIYIIISVIFYCIGIGKDAIVVVVLVVSACLLVLVCC